MEAPMDPLLASQPADLPAESEEQAPAYLWLVGAEGAPSPSARRPHPTDGSTSAKAGAAPNRPPIDHTIVELAAAGDENAFTALVRWYHPRFIRFARHMLRNDTEADDAVQEAFIRVYRALPYYRERERFESWLFRILANCCRTALSRNRRLSLRLVGLNTPEARSVYDRSDTRDDAAWRALLDAALDTLPVEQREAFLLHHVDGHSYESMSEITGVRQSALKMRVKRACDRLRAMLGEVSHA